MNRQTVNRMQISINSLHLSDLQGTLFKILLYVYSYCCCVVGNVPQLCLEKETTIHSSVAKQRITYESPELPINKEICLFLTFSYEYIALLALYVYFESVILHAFTKISSGEICILHSYSTVLLTHQGSFRNKGSISPQNT